MKGRHYVKSVRIWSYSGPHFSRIFRMRENAGKMWIRITPNKDIFYAVREVQFSSQRVTFGIIALYPQSRPVDLPLSLNTRYL